MSWRDARYIVVKQQSVVYVTKANSSAFLYKPQFISLVLGLNLEKA